MEKYESAHIIGVSYIGNPKSHTCMYLTKKIEQTLLNLEAVEGCLVFLEDTIKIPENLLEKHTFFSTPFPQLEYVRYVKQFQENKEREDRKRKYTLTEQGYYIGENVTIGENAYIEPTCLIGHDVVIGKNAKIFAGAKIKNAQIGDNFIAGENCSIGAYGFTMTEDEDRNKLRIPTLGKVIIGDNVEVGALNNIHRGSSGNTILSDYVKTDALVHLAHDVILKCNVELPAGVIIGGFTVLNEGAYVGLNATLRNRIELGENVIVGMGAAVLKNVEANKTVAGNPAKILEKKEK